MQRHSRKISLMFLALTFSEAFATSDKGRNTEIGKDFEREKIAYIRQYAVPKSSASPKSELLFTKRAAAPKTYSPAAPQPAAPQPAAPPPPSEPGNE